MTIKPFAFCAFFLVTAPTHADPAAPLPAIVQKYVAAVQNAGTVYASAAQTEPEGAAPDTGQIDLVALPVPMLTVLSHYASKSTTLTMNGKTLTQWNAKQISTQPAPKTLAEVSPSLPMGAAAGIALSLLTDATSIIKYANLKDTGPALVDNQPARKVVSIEDGDTATFWLSTKTGLPLQARYTSGSRVRLISIHYTSVSAGTPGSFLSPIPPKGLQVYTPPAQGPLLPAGTPAPDWTLPRLSQYGTGKSTVTLSALKGKVVLIDFWAAWCPDCRRTMPHTQQIHAQTGNALTVISVNTWDTPARAAAFLQTHPQYSTQFVADFAPSDTSLATRKYNVFDIPTVYIIDKDGNVAGAFIAYKPGAAQQIAATLSKLGVAL